MSEFYVYQYLRQSNQTPYYIGKGKGPRAFKKGAHRRQGINEPPNPDNIVIVQDNLTEHEAWDLEIELIAKHGRKDLGTGILLNRTAGGEGHTGPSPFKGKKLEEIVGCPIKAKQLKEKNSARQKGKRTGKDNPFYGKTHPSKGKNFSAEELKAHHERMVIRKAKCFVPWNKGKKASPELRKILSEKRKQYWIKKKALLNYH